MTTEEKLAEVREAKKEVQKEMKKMDRVMNQLIEAHNEAVTLEQKLVKQLAEDKKRIITLQ